MQSQPGGNTLPGKTNLVDLMKDGVEQPTGESTYPRRLDLKRILATPEGGALIESGAKKQCNRQSHVNSELSIRSYHKRFCSGATTQLRNMATAGGNLLQRTRCPYFMQPSFAMCNKRLPGSGCAAWNGFNREHALFGASTSCVAVHPSDMAVALAILDAFVHVQGAQGKRSIPLNAFFRLPEDTPQYDNTLHSAELIVGIEIPPSTFGRHSWYLKVRDRHSYAFGRSQLPSAWS